MKFIITLLILLVPFNAYAEDNLLESKTPWGENFTAGDLELISFYYKTAEEIGAVGACSVEKGRIMFECADMMIGNWERLYPGFKWSDDKYKHMRSDFQIKVLFENLQYKKAVSEGKFSCKQAGIIEDQSNLWNYCKVSK